MSYIIMATGEDGTEFRVGDDEYQDEEEAWAAVPEAESHYPCARVYVTEYLDRAHFERVHQDRYDNDEYDLY